MCSAEEFIDTPGGRPKPAGAGRDGPFPGPGGPIHQGPARRPGGRDSDDASPELSYLISNQVIQVIMIGNSS